MQQETLDELADHLNIKDKIAPITAKAMAGEIDFYEALRMRVKLLRGLPVSALHETIGKIDYSKIKQLDYFKGINFEDLKYSK